jgi:hypothetical protein
MIALPLKAIAPAAAKSKPDSEERLGEDIGTSLFALTHNSLHNDTKKALKRHASD